MLVGLQGQVRKTPIQTWYFFPFIFLFSYSHTFGLAYRHSGN